jgi:hypothetical protein
VSYLIPILLVLLTLPLAIKLLRANELFVLRVSGRRMRIVRGRLPQRLLDELSDVIERSGVDEADVIAVVEDGRARVTMKGPQVPRGLQQQLRNTISQWPVAKIRSAPRPSRAPSSLRRPRR